MKKIKMSVAALLIAGMSYSQTIKPNQVVLNEFEVIEMINTIEDILEWHKEDENNGDYSHGSYEEGWGSAYWLTIMKEQLILKLRTRQIKN
tara:strand:+ start:194 stop:466 length:273 start_codon:yes stop_codon:yes gene_type:complete